MDEEMMALQKNQTWEVMLLLKEKKTVGCRWVYMIKYKSNGTIERFKAWLVAKGFTQCYGIDYMETFASVAKMGIVSILISLAVHYGWSLLQYDVKNTFLYGEILEKIYMELPLGYKDPNDTLKECRLKKALYGLKYLGKMTILLVYVNDLIVTGNDMQEITSLQKQLRAVFDFKVLGQLKYLLEIEVAYSPAQQVLAYLQGTIGMGILFKRGDSLRVDIYTDVDYAGSVDDRHSTICYCCLIGGNLVTW
ncbi:unnamed protein product [Spirodela intermedia]|uniref:Reverse transcriptase Ty1/copia-type domain-containing protein n=1 Tax=Spirodela intermedia TaxID=51605 RepID=A0A7I8KG86_SPIIN|nr:unnamed protein product [Spirodela intermedia]